MRILVYHEYMCISIYVYVGCMPYVHNYTRQTSILHVMMLTGTAIFPAIETSSCGDRAGKGTTLCKSEVVGSRMGSGLQPGAPFGGP